MLGDLDRARDHFEGKCLRTFVRRPRNFYFAGRRHFGLSGLNELFHKFTGFSFFFASLWDRAHGEIAGGIAKARCVSANTSGACSMFVEARGPGRWLFGVGACILIQCSARVSTKHLMETRSCRSRACRSACGSPQRSHASSSDLRRAGASGTRLCRSGAHALGTGVRGRDCFRSGTRRITRL